ncbi:uncharacterized protein A1O9_02851 [Exophiala aquamarina CBS 119918]|uniref:Transcription factor domain-containing protein n=1 Tax=Exophiala aquamarina CBS 119918 TaxID=1182545 RepID=A0A072PN61_9EURO|nr:uncharacterized protein A1O9_02851 [Exophiala aquamarina CBS 119918]KEF61286.1 hypothetical protein A1O9_02851 [Exophiala aquamarina CBS 119918]
MADTTDRNAQAFTFLNYNTPSHSASHRRAVKSHISSKYRTAVRQQAEPRYALPQRLAFETLPADVVDHRTTAPVRKRKRSSPESQQIGLRKLAQPPILSPITTISAGFRTDPFDSLPGERTPCVTRALDYYVNVLSPLQEPLRLTLNMVNPLMTLIFPLIVSNQSTYHGAVALSQAYLEKNYSPTSRPSPEVDFHRQKAVALLRDQLNSLDGPPDNGALVTVLALASLDVVYQEDTMTNRKGVALLVALKGGLDNLGSRGLMKSYLVNFDFFWMLETGDKSIFPLSKRKQLREYPQLPFNPNTLSLVSTLPPGFSAVARQGSLGIDVLQILSRVSRPGSAAGSDASADGHDSPDIFDACSCLHASSSTEHSLEKNLCLALILFSFNIHNPTARLAKITAYRGSRKELTRSLPFTRHRNTDERNCLIWIWIVLFGSWGLDSNFGHNTFELARSFFENFEEAARWEEVESIMRQFFWHEALARRWYDSWQEALGNFQCGARANTSRLPSLRPSPHGLHGRYSIPVRSPFIDDMKQSRRRTPAPALTALRTPFQGDEEEEHGALVLPPMLTLDTYYGQVK